MQLLADQPLKEIRPGVKRRSVKHVGETYSETLRYCADCGIECFSTEHIMCPIVLDELWKIVAPNNGILCLLCFEKRLGREIKSSDLKPGVPMNSLFNLLLLRAER